MPVIKQAIKKVRQDKRKTTINSVLRTNYKKAVLTSRRSKTEASLKAAFRALDRAAKTNVIHKNKASRLKSRLSKMLASTAKAATPKAAVKKAAA